MRKVFLTLALTSSLFAQTKIKPGNKDIRQPNSADKNTTRLYAQIQGQNFLVPIVLGENLNLTLLTNPSGQRTLVLSAAAPPSELPKQIVAQAALKPSTSDIYTIPNTIPPGRGLIVVVNGLTYTESIDFTRVAPNEIRFLPASLPTNEDLVIFIYPGV